MTALAKLVDGSTTMAAFESSFNSVVDRQNMVFAFDATETTQSLAHLASWSLGDTFRTTYFDSAKEDGSAGAWKAVANSNLGPVGTLGYRVFYGATVPGSPDLLTVLSALGFTAGMTVMINSATITFVASGASGNNQINVGDRLKALLVKMQAIMAANSSLGDRSRVDLLSGALTLQSSDGNNLVTADLVLAGTGLSLLGLTAGTYAFPEGICLEGSSARWQFVPDAGNVIDIRSLGNKCDGVTAASRTRFNSTLWGAAALGYFLVNSLGTRSDLSNYLKIDRTFDARRVSCDLAVQIGTPVNATTTPGSIGDFFDETAHIGYLVDRAAWVSGGSNPDTEPSNPNSGVEVFEYVNWSGGTSYRGIGLYGSGDSSNALFCRQRFNIRGDGNFNYTTFPTAIGVIFEDDNSAAGNYEVAGSYLAIGMVVAENQEKNRIRGAFTYCDWCAMGVYTGSVTPDTMLVEIEGQNCRHIVWEEEGFDSSVHWLLRFEGRDDPADGSPSIYLRNGKYSKLSGVFRAGNGDLQVLVDKTTNAGCDTVEFNFTMIDCYGRVEIARCRYVEGRLMIRDGKNLQNGVTEGPGIWMKRVMNAGNFHCTLVKDQHRESVRFGDASTGVYANGIYSKKAHMGHYSISRSTVGTFNNDGSVNGSWPGTGITGAVVEKIDGGTIVVEQCDGNIDILAGAVGNTTIIVPRDFPATIDIDPSAVVSVGYPTLSTSGLTIT